MWKVKQTPEFKEWFQIQEYDVRKHILRDIKILSEIGPVLGRPKADTIQGSTLSNLKELRVQSNGKPFRIFYIFDVERNALLLIGGNKAGDKRFYKKMIPLAEQIYRKYSAEFKNEKYE